LHCCLMAEIVSKAVDGPESVGFREGGKIAVPPDLPACRADNGAIGKAPDQQPQPEPQPQVDPIRSKIAVPQAPTKAGSTKGKVSEQWKLHESAKEHTLEQAANAEMRRYLNQKYSKYLSDSISTTDGMVAKNVKRIDNRSETLLNKSSDAATSTTRQHALDKVIDANDKPAMASAVQQGGKLATKGIRPSGPDVHCTPLHCAALQGHLTAVECPIVCGADLTAANKEGAHPLHLAVANGMVAVAKVLLVSGADVVDTGIATALHHAAMAGELAAVQLLIGQGADLEAKQHNGCTALHLAARQGYAAVSEVLLVRGADPMALDTDNATPLHYAARAGQYTPAEILIFRGAEASAVDVENATPLHYAAAAGHLALVEFLVQNGADSVSQMTRSGCTPLHLGIQGGHNDTAEWLAGEIKSNHALRACTARLPYFAHLATLVTPHRPPPPPASSSQYRSARSTSHV
jgi:ankyrin repeat protein